MLVFSLAAPCKGRAGASLAAHAAVPEGPVATRTPLRGVQSEPGPALLFLGRCPVVEASLL
eukprot:6861904-Pyramimonas_sp.AAC.1